MSTPSPAQLPTESTGLRVVSLLVSAAAVGVLVWIAAGRPPLRLSFLRGLMALTQNTARAIGGAGLAFENAYRHALETDTLA